MRTIRSTLLLVLVSIPSSAFCFGGEGEWLQWRGPQRDGTLDAGALPASLADDQLVERWTAPLGPSYSGPLVLQDRVIVTETRDRKVEVVTAFQRDSGKLLWKTEWEGSLRVPFFAAANGSWIRATPASDGQRIYVAGIRDLLVCLDVQTGQKLWELDFSKQFGAPVPSFGFVSSPMILGDHLYVQAGGAFVKLNKVSGEIVWRTLADGGGMLGGAFSSPVAAKINGQTQLVVQTRTRLAGVSPDTGDLLWDQEIPAFRGMNILTPTLIDQRLFTSSYGGKAYAFDLAQDGGQWKVNEAWTNKLQAYMSSPLVVDGHLYLHLKNQRFACIEAATGKVCWTTRPFGKYWSLVAAGDQILALDQRGELLLIRANPEKFELLGRREIADDTWAHLSVAGKQLFIRDLKELKVFDFNLASKPSP